MRQIMLRIAYAMAALILASDCAVSSELRDSLIAADRQCIRDEFLSEVPKVTCFTAVEEPVIRQGAPAALATFQIFVKQGLLWHNSMMRST